MGMDFNVVMDIGHADDGGNSCIISFHRVHLMQEIIRQLYFVPDSWILYRARL